MIPRFEQAAGENKTLVVDLDGGYGYASSFLEEAFGGLVRSKELQLSKAKAIALVQRVVRFVSAEEPYLIRDIERYIREACDR